MQNIAPGPEETLDKLCPDWHVFQLRKGHRFSTDDLVVAFHASEARPHAKRLLDLGCGIGSVGLSTLWRVHPEATMVGVEAQDISVGLLRRSLAYNGLEDRFELRHGDLRDPNILGEDEKFELITGSPPYMPVGHGIISPHTQKAHCRVELRGSVYDYCLTAKRHLAPGGRFCFVMLAGDPRTEDAPIQAGLTVLERWDIVFREGKPPHIATLLCAHAEEVPEDHQRTTKTLVIRDATGAWTPEYEAHRQETGIAKRADNVG